MQLNKKELKHIKIDVIDKTGKKLAPTNGLVAQVLIAREKAEWIIENKTLRLLKTKQDWKELKKRVVEEENRVCYICKEIIPNDIPATVDHVNPKSKFGKDDRANLRCCCKRCNDDKGNMDLSEYHNHVKLNIEKYNYLKLSELEKLKNEFENI